MDSRTDDSPKTSRTTRRGLLAGLAGLAALVFGRKARRQDDRDKPAKRNGRLPWIGHY